MKENKFFLVLFFILSWCNDTFSISDTKCYDRDKYLQYVFYPKYVLGQCYHLCKRCDHYEDCFGNLDIEE